MFINYPEIIQDKYRKVFLLGRGSHSNKVMLEKISDLADILEYEISMK